MKRFVVLIGLLLGLGLLSGEAFAAGSKEVDEPSRPNGGSSGNSSNVSGTRTKYSPSDAAAAVNPDGEDNTVTISF